MRVMEFIHLVLGWILIKCLLKEAKDVGTDEDCCSALFSINVRTDLFSSCCSKGAGGEETESQERMPTSDPPQRRSMSMAEQCGIVEEQWAARYGKYVQDIYFDGRLLIAFLGSRRPSVCE